MEMCVRDEKSGDVEVRAAGQAFNASCRKDAPAVAGKRRSLSSTFVATKNPSSQFGHLHRGFTGDHGYDLSSTCANVDAADLLCT